MGFGDRWVNWIKWCATTASFSILINGSAKEYFKSSRGLRQSNPFSPYLFILIMEAFGYLMQRAEQWGFVSGWKVAYGERSGSNISH